MTDISPDYFTKPVSEVDPEIAEVLENELRRQETTLEMIASENFVPQAVLDCQGSVLTNKYAEGYPGRRYYGGCEFVDVAEQLAIDRAKALFGAEHANVQPHSGAQANAAVYHALLEPGRQDPRHEARPRRPPLARHEDQLLRPALRRRSPTTCAREDSLVDMDEVARLAEEHQPKLIIAGWSAYPRQLDFAALPRDRRLGGRLPDGRHGALRGPGRRRAAPQPGAARARGHHHDPQDARRPARRRDPVQRGAAKKINSAVFPGQQGGPLEHVIAGKAVAFKIAASRRSSASASGARWRGAPAALAEEMLVAPA